MRIIEEIKRWLCEFTEILLLLVALAVVAEVLFGSTVGFFGQVVPNLTALIASFGENGLVGLVALGIVVWLIQRRTTVVQQHQHQQ